MTVLKPENVLQRAFFSSNFNYKNYLKLELTSSVDHAKEPKGVNFYPSAKLEYNLSPHINLPVFINEAKFNLGYSKFKYQPGKTNYNIILSNQELKPQYEEKSIYEVGFDLALLNGKMNFDFTFYYALTNSKLFRYNFIGLNNVWVNQFDTKNKIRNRGVEINISNKIIDNNIYSWSSNLNIYANRNKVLQLNSSYQNASLLDQDFPYVSAIMVEGGSVFDIYGTSYQRLSDNTSNKSYKINKSEPIVIGADGLPLKGNGKILGNTDPKWIIGYSNQFKFKNFSLNTLIESRLGFQMYNYMDYFSVKNGLSERTLERNVYKVIEGVLENGTPNNKAVWLGPKIEPGIGFGDPNYAINYYTWSTTYFAEEFVQNASYVSLKSVNLTYDFPIKWLPKKVISNLSLSLIANNLWNSNKAYGLNFQKDYQNLTENFKEVDFFTYPTTKSYLLSLKVGFK